MFVRKALKCLLAVFLIVTLRTSFVRAETTDLQAINRPRMIVSEPETPVVATAEKGKSGGGKWVWALLLVLGVGAAVAGAGGGGGGGGSDGDSGSGSVGVGW